LEKCRFRLTEMGRMPVSFGAMDINDKR
jgi:hypothetical protein